MTLPSTRPNPNATPSPDPNPNPRLEGPSLSPNPNPNPQHYIAPKPPGFTPGKILLFGMLGLIAVFLLSLMLAFSGMVNSTRALFKVNTSYSSAVASTIGDLKREQKLVVLSVPITVMLKRVSEKNLGGFLPLGTTELMMVVDDNRVQYVLRLDQLKAEDFTLDAGKKTITVRVPPPELDIDMVSVQSDPAKIHVMTNVGWASLDSSSGEKLRELARRELRETVIGEGMRPFIQEQAKQSAELNMRKLLTPLIRTLEDGVELKIEFKGAKPTP